MHQHTLHVPGKRYTPVDGESIPTGELVAVDSTPYDLTGDEQQLQDSLNKLEPHGIDHNYELELRSAQAQRGAGVVQTAPMTARHVQQCERRDGSKPDIARSHRATLLARSSHLQDAEVCNVSVCVPELLRSLVITAQLPLKLYASVQKHASAVQVACLRWMRQTGP